MRCAQRASESKTNSPQPQTKETQNTKNTKLTTTPQKFLITPLTRRTFNNGVLTNNLDEQAAKSKAAAAATKVPVIDLNGASKKYVQAIGKSEAIKLDADYRDAKDASTTKDFTHLNAKASGLFGRMVADLLYGQVPEIGHWIKSDRALSAAIAAGKAVV